MLDGNTADCEAKIFPKAALQQGYWGIREVRYWKRGEGGKVDALIRVQRVLGRRGLRSKVGGGGKDERVGSLAAGAGSRRDPLGVFKGFSRWKSLDGFGHKVLQDLYGMVRTGLLLVLIGVL